MNFLKKSIFLLFVFGIISSVSVGAQESVVASASEEEEPPVMVEEEAVVGEAENESAISSDEAPVMEISESESGKGLYSIELRNVELGDFFRVVAYTYNLNLLVDRTVQGRITASLRDITIDESLDRIAEMYDLIFEQKGNVIVVKPNVVTETFILKNIMVQDLLESYQQESVEGQEQDINGSTSTIYDLLSEKGKIFFGKQINSIVVMDYARNVQSVGDFIEAVDKKTSVKIFKLKYLSVKDLFPDLRDDERNERTKQREERRSERNEMKEIKESEN